jgi:phage tail-like protein
MILSGGDAGSMQAFEMWRKEAANGKPDSARHTVMILCKDALGNTVARYKLTHAWPTRLTTGDAAAAKGSAANTTVELAYEKMEIVH